VQGGETIPESNAVAGKVDSPLLVGAISPASFEHEEEGEKWDGTEAVPPWEMNGRRDEN
jgi:hypothetical protein